MLYHISLFTLHTNQNMTQRKYFYKFQPGYAEGNSSMTNILGNKGANLAELSALNIPVPPGFTLTLDFCRLYQQDSKKFEKQLEIILPEAVSWLENITQKSFGKKSKNILLLSVRSGSVKSMPGMMNTVLNIGINDQIYNHMLNTSEKKFVCDIYRRFLIYYATNIFNIDYKSFPKENFTKKYLTQTNNLEYLIKQNEQIIKFRGFRIETNVFIQLKNAIISVIKSWNNPQAKEYRKNNNIEENIGTAVTIQSMVYGNTSECSGSGVFFTRSPLNGEKKIFGEFLFESQGEDIVSGQFTPVSISETNTELKQRIPNLCQELQNTSKILEAHYKDMQDIEFTVENKKTYILQTRSGKRNAFSAMKILYDMVLENKLSKAEAIRRLQKTEINNLLYNQIKDKNQIHISQSTGESFGAITGKAVFSLQEIEKYSKSGKVILIIEEATAEDNNLIQISDAVLSLKGGSTSHAAVVTRAMGKIFLCGVTDLYLNKNPNSLIGSNNIVIKPGDDLTLDGYSGKIFLGKIDLIESKTPKEFFKILQWAQEHSKIQVRSNADSKKDLEKSLNYGVNAIGLCRTEHMFFSEKKMLSLYQMLFSKNDQMNDLAIKQLISFQKNEFLEIFKLVSNNIINIRLLDMPLHEFLPKDTKYKENICKNLQISSTELESKISYLSESNPMLGHRGVRLAITHPKIYAMQIQAIFEALKSLYVKFGQQIHLEIMIPFICNELEVIFCKNLLTNYIRSLKDTYYLSLKFGCMIELPRAAIISDKIAPHVDFVSFGTNDLTQTTCGISRDDVNKFFNTYSEKKIFNKNYFTTIDQEGVGEIIKISISKLRAFNKKIKIGVCGEHGADLESIKFFSTLGIDYVSCSPDKLPQAQIFVSQVNLEKN